MQPGVEKLCAQNAELEGMIGMQTKLQPFHLAFPVSDLEATRRFYLDTLGCQLGRESDRWIDFDFFGHQITAHLI